VPSTCSVHSTGFRSGVEYLLKLVSWSLTSLLSTNMAISETRVFAEILRCNVLMNY